MSNAYIGCKAIQISHNLTYRRTRRILIFLPANIYFLYDIRYQIGILHFFLEGVCFSQKTGRRDDGDKTASHVTIPRIQNGGTI